MALKIMRMNKIIVEKRLLKHAFYHTFKSLNHTPLSTTLPTEHTRTNQLWKIRILFKSSRAKPTTIAKSLNKDIKPKAVID